jgi:enoyl-CoA hydratase
MTSYETILYEQGEHGVVRIALNQPESRNALSAQLLGELTAALERAAEEDAVRCVVLASTDERVFSSGANLAGFAAESSLLEKHFGSERFLALFRALLSYPKPTICVARGHVLAGALGIALACDLVLAGEEASFGLPEIKIGAFPFMVMALLYRNLPHKKANELLLLGERISAQEACAAGIVNRVVPEAQLDALVGEWAQALAGRSRAIMRLGKEAMATQAEMGLDQALSYLRSQLSLALSSDDIREGVSAFFEKREPRWRDG